MHRRGRRSLIAIILGLSLVGLLLAPIPATAHHATFEDCSQQAGVVCWPDGDGVVAFYDPFHVPCRFDATIDWGDGASDTVSNWQDLQEVHHQYTSHGFFTIVVVRTATPEQDGYDCPTGTDTHHAEVPVPAGEPTPTPTPTPGPEGRIASSTFPFNHRIDQAKQQLQTKIDPLVAQHNDLEAQLTAKQGSLENQIELHAFRLANVRSIEAELSELRQDIADGIGSEDSDEMVRLRQFLRNAQLEELAQRLVMQNMERDVRALMLRRDEAARKLLEFSEPLEALDFELLGMIVEAKGGPVYAVTLTSPYRRLAQLDDEIREMNQLLEELKAQRIAALKDFSDAHQDASAKLSFVERVIWNNALVSASVEAGSFAVDLMVASTKGGIAGVAAELTSKLFEAAYKYSKLDPVGDPNPGAAAVDEWVRSSMVDEVGDQAPLMAVERGVKETVGKIAKDYIADALESRYPDLGPTTPHGDPAQKLHRAMQRARGFVQRLKDLKPKLSSETFRKGFKDWSTKSVGRKLLQDSVKAFINQRLKDDEIAAWRDYIMLNSRAQALFGVWQASANAYWEVVDQRDAKELEKARILDEYDPNTRQSLKKQESFETPATIRIELVVRDSKTPFANVPVQVWVSGGQATRAGGKVWRVSTDALLEGDLGAWTIEVR